ncbi:MAG: ribosomal RNA small subunit methyltransferase A [Candidatus Liptonbacteria bacterium]|nr:ribosomal RNA small subunit methyltransferase A [Candidatus Liptonbacteria bacterium]
MSKRLGQHFLINKRILQKISTSLEIKDNDTIIEIGPGHGELTEEILKIKDKKSKIIVIEKDKDLAGALRLKYQNNKNIEIIEGDALKVLPEITIPHTPDPKPYKLAGNIPYYITGRLFRIIGEIEQKPQICVFTIQKEVAERVAAKPPRMNLLAASLQVWADVKIIETVPARYFNPPPKVDSAVIKLITKPPELINLKTYELTNHYKILRILFRQPRKTILNNLSDGLGLKKSEIVAKLKKIGTKPTDRPQNLSMEDMVKLSVCFQ